MQCVAVLSEMTGILPEACLAAHPTNPDLQDMEELSIRIQMDSMEREGILMMNHFPKSDRNVLRFLTGQRGSSMIFFALSLMVIAGSAALVTDIGMLAIDKARLGNAVDAATLAAARAHLERPGTERSVAASYLEKTDSQEWNSPLTSTIMTMNLRLSLQKMFHTDLEGY